MYPCHWTARPGTRARAAPLSGQTRALTRRDTCRGRTYFGEATAQGDLFRGRQLLPFHFVQAPAFLQGRLRPRLLRRARRVLALLKRLRRVLWRCLAVRLPPIPPTPPPPPALFSAVHRWSPRLNAPDSTKELQSLIVWRTQRESAQRRLHLRPHRSRRCGPNAACGSAGGAAGPSDVLQAYRCQQLAARLPLFGTTVMVSRRRLWRDGDWITKLDVRHA